LRISICGSASVGKTTLAHALAQNLRLTCIREEMRDYLQATAVDLAALPLDEVEAVLLALWRERQQQELTTEAFVADTSALDFAAHALYYDCLSAANQKTLITQAIVHLDRYDAIIVLPWGVLPYEQDGIRPLDPYSQLRYQMLLEGLLRRHVSANRLYFVPQVLLHLDDRVRWTMTSLASIRARVGKSSSALSEPNSSQTKGRVYLVGAGPGDPKLLTLRAAELLQHADAVAYDLLISPELLAQVPANTPLLPVGRRNGVGVVDYRLHPDAMALAMNGKTVVRLKCGDPLLFGRGGEEAEELRQAGIPFEIVPGITAALGAAAYAGIPLTHRGQASKVSIRSGHEALDNENCSDVAAGEPAHRTTVVYMAARRLKANLARLQIEGYPAETPAALILSATTPRQKVIVGALATLSHQVPMLRPEVPAILFVGHVVSLRESLQWFQTGQF